MPKLKDFFPSKYLKKEDVPELDEDGKGGMVVTMKMVDVEKLGDDEKPVLYFRESKPMVLNRGNADTIEKMYGPDTDDWVGQKITIYHDPEVRFGTETVGGIRVKKKKPKTAEPVKAEALRDKPKPMPADEFDEFHDSE